MRSDSPRLRLGMVGVVAVSLFAALFARLWYLQVLASPEYQLQASANQQRVVVEPAPRGRILDRNGVILVDNRLSFVVSLDRTVLRDMADDERSALFDRLVAELATAEPGIDVAILEERLESTRYSPYQPVPVADDIPETLAVYLQERQDDFGGALHVDARAIRTYPYGQLAAHVLGYVGAINGEEYEARQQSPLQYQLTDEIGKSGVEQSYEEVLRGQPGRRVLEVDARGDTIRELEYDPPVAGNDLYLTIDARVQAVAEVALQDELERARGRRMRDGTAQAAPAGSVVVEDPRDGSIVAMASYPTFHPGALTDGIDDAEFDLVFGEATHVPALNRTIQGQYAPGSTFKLITAFAGLTSGLITPETPWDDRGVYTVPNCNGDSCTFRNAGSEPHGTVDLAEAITVSSDTYFYDLGARSWINRPTLGDPIQEAATTFGLGTDTGIPLANERSGWIPTPENKAQRHEDNPDAFPYGEWRTGDNVNMSVGQGDVVVTPLQLANAYSALANGGTLLSPNIASRVTRSNAPDDVVRSYDARPVRTIAFQPGWRESMVAGFEGVTQNEAGTAHGTFEGFPNWIVAGKTGTAQVTGRADTSLFVGWGPYEAPQYLAAAILEESGFGGQAAGPLVRRIFESIADPALTPTVVSDPTSPFGFTLSVALAEAVDAQASGDQGD